VTFYEKSVIDNACMAFTRWSGWGPPTSEYQIIEFCQAKANNEFEAKEFTEILTRWMGGEYECKPPLWFQDQD
jgi:hypothetical protein